MKIRRLVTAFLALLLVLSGLSFACPSAKAEGDWSNGGLSYSFAGGVLTISASPDVPDGKNWMHDFDSESRPPWEAKYGRDAIKTIRIKTAMRRIRMAVQAVRTIFAINSTSIINLFQSA